MADLVQHGNFTVVSGGVGTTTIKESVTTFKRILVPGTYIGTINFHDASSAAGTTTTSQIYSMGIPTVTYPFFIDVGVRCKNGLTYQATGTPTVTVVWE